MSLGTLLVILLAWTVAGLLAAIAFGKTIRDIAPDEEEGLASPAGTLKYLRKNKNRPDGATERSPATRHTAAKKLSG